MDIDKDEVENCRIEEAAARKEETARISVSRPRCTERFTPTTTNSKAMLEGRNGKTLLIRNEFLNHYGTLFGGYMMQWANDMACNAASLAFPDARFVTKLFGQFDFTSPAHCGDIIKIFSEVEAWALRPAASKSGP
jgi:acyl-coenzyme A thioesterase PaaI-like protein